MKFLQGIAAIALSIFVFGCDSDRLYEDQKDFNHRIWAATDTAKFEFQILDTGSPYHVYLTVRNSIDYPYSRLFVNYALRDSVGNVLQEKLMTSYLFDMKTGEPNGSSGLGDLYDHKELLLENFSFAQPGKYHLQLLQYMRQDSLPGIVAVGARVETAGNK
jgi:gliding motility-associated lipoprotein GldH